ncbi:MAG: hypothetical protein ACKPJJ_28460, partial [Planctomycetaceae bacterium]
QHPRPHKASPRSQLVRIDDPRHLKVSLSTQDTALKQAPCARQPFVRCQRLRKGLFRGTCQGWKACATLNTQPHLFPFVVDSRPVIFIGHPAAVYPNSP